MPIEITTIYTIYVLSVIKGDIFFCSYEIYYDAMGALVFGPLFFRMSSFAYDKNHPSRFFAIVDSQASRGWSLHSFRLL